jgi:hypothetical protein
MVAAAEQRGFTDAKPMGEHTPEIPAATPTETPAADPAASAAAAPAEGNAAETDHSYSLEEDGFIGARDLAAKIDANPNLKANLDPETRNEIMANARLAEALSPYRELFASPEEAKIVAQTAQEHAGFVEAFNLIGSDIGKGTDAVIKKLIEAGAKRDAKGEIIRKENGQPVTNGIAGKFFEQVFNNALNNKIIAKVEALGDENVKAALDLVMESVGLRPSTADKTGNQDPAIAAERAQLAAERADLAKQRETSTKEQRRQYQTTLDGEITALYESETGNLLSLATGLDAFTKDAVKGKLDKAVKAAIRTNVAYQMEKDRITAQPISPERLASEKALVNSFLRNNLSRIARPILMEAGAIATKKASDRATAQAARAESAQSEVNGGKAQNPNQPAAANPSQQIEQIKTALTAKLGREPDQSEINIEMMLAAARAKGFAA